MARSCRKQWTARLAFATGAAAAVLLATVATAGSPSATAAPPAATPAVGAPPAAAAPATLQLVAGPDRPAARAGQQPITVDAASSQVDYRTNTVLFTQVVITQGATRVQADRARATGLDFANSRWQFSGHVRIDAEQHGSLRSDEAVVEFRDNRIARATATGKPAEFEQPRPETQQTAHGHADQIVYDVSDGTVRLSDEAWVSDGQNEMSAPMLVYNIRTQSMQGTGTPGGQRVHITITPHSTAPPGKAEGTRPEPQRPAPGPQP
jgi:lipopolysaccharide transport protein LptA